MNLEGRYAYHIFHLFIITLADLLQTSILYESITTNPIRIALLLRLPPPSVALTPEVRCAVVGNVDSGKSTTLGVLTRGALDDGRGRARVSLFRHKHEVESGRTSSVGMEVCQCGLQNTSVFLMDVRSWVSDLPVPPSYLRHPIPRSWM